MKSEERRLRLSTSDAGNSGKVPEVVKIHQDMIDLMAQRSREIILNPNTSSDAIDQLQEQITV